jgi:hypothetical protein
MPLPSTAVPSQGDSSAGRACAPLRTHFCMGH